MLIRRLLTVLTALLGAAGFLLAVQGGQWWSIGEIGIGPISTQHCYGGACGAGGLTWAGGSDAWYRAGFATYAAGLCAAVVFVALAGARAAGSSGRLAAAVGAVAAMTATTAGAVFLWASPALPGSVIGRGVWLYGAAIVAAGVAVAMTLKRDARVDPT